MNNSSTSAIDNLPLQYSQIPAFTWWTIAGLVNTVVSVWITTVLVVWKPMQGPALKLIVQLTVMEGVTSLFNAAIGLYHVKKASTDEVETGSQFNCWLMVGVDYFLIVILASLCLVISFDRFLGAVFPTQYQFKPDFYCVLLSSVAWILSALFYVISYFATSQTVYISVCQVSQCIAPWFYNFYKYLTFVLSLFSVLLYVATLTVLRYQIKEAEKQGGSIVDIKKRMRSKVSKVLAANAVVHLCTVTLADFGTGIATMFTTKGALLGPYFASLYFVGCSTCLPIYLTFQQQFRQGSVELFIKLATFKCSAINKVEPSSSVTRTTK